MSADLLGICHDALVHGIQNAVPLPHHLERERESERERERRERARVRESACCVCVKERELEREIEKRENRARAHTHTHTSHHITSHHMRMNISVVNHLFLISIPSPSSPSRTLPTNSNYLQLFKPTLTITNFGKQLYLSRTLPTNSHSYTERMPYIETCTQLTAS